MTPDTSAYMIAGFAVIFAGMIIYLAALILRARALRKKADRHSSREDEE